MVASVFGMKCLPEVATRKNPVEMRKFRG